MTLMKTTARYNETTTTMPNAKAVAIFAENKRDAQDAIKLAQAWVRANGGKYKLVSFTSAPRNYSNLDIVYRARIVYMLAA